MTFKALLATQAGSTISTQVVDLSDQDLMAGDVTVAVEFLSLIHI